MWVLIAKYAAILIIMLLVFKAGHTVINNNDVTGIGSCPIGSH